MTTKIKAPKQALNPAFVKQKPEPKEMEFFKQELNLLLAKINEKETEEHNKNLLKNFLSEVYYKTDYEINVYNDTKNKIRVDFAIKPKDKTFAEVLVEVKRPTKNQSEMLSINSLNRKALHELLLYYMSERMNNNNKSLRHLIVTNLYEWFVFDAKDFYELLYSDNTFKDTFIQYDRKQLEGDKTKYFYEEIAPDIIEKITDKITFVHFDIRDYKNRNVNDEDFVALYKFLSPTHLLKKNILPDNNKLNREFYSELLHILGLTETELKGKIRIERKSKDRDEGSLLELTIAQLEITDISQIKDLNIYGDNRAEQLFGIAFALVITWINRILFMKLLEAQLLKYHDNNADYAFLSPEKIIDYGKLNTLFFQILAQTSDKRTAHYLQEFKKVPYLNSSLFEETKLEKTLKISTLLNGVFLPLYGKTVLAGKTNDALNYLLKFLNAYNFSGKQNADENPNKLISAAVLGLIFEKINGYKDGSFFTPSFITMYICRETIGRAIMQKFNSAKGWNCQTIDDLHNHIGKNTQDIKEANEIFNTIRICDPAVGSGHFLVSALNEMIYLKAELGILADETYKTLNIYQINIENDELIVKCDGEHFQYKPQNAESQRIQKTLFHEKQSIIENCLFGVDINPNSVQICQLRLWIELLKHAYYKAPSSSSEGRKQSSSFGGFRGSLETLPNIDINIKCGNSLINRFDLADKYHNIPGLEQKIRQATKNYKMQVFFYKRCDNKEAKRQIIKKIEAEKEIFYRIKNAKDPDWQILEKTKNELALHTQSFNFFAAENDEWNNKTTELTDKVHKLETKYNEKIRGCFEWRFEFPEVLDDDGNFEGFDVVMGNPPYIQLQSMDSITDAYKNMNYKVLNVQAIFIAFSTN